MEMAEIPKLDLLSPSSSFPKGYGEALESEQKNMGTQRISVSDHINAFQYTPDKADSFVIDMDAFSSGINKDTTNASSRTTLQRSLSRKGSQRGVDRKVNGNATLHDKDTVPATCSPRAPLVGSCTPEKAPVVSTDHSMNPHFHHQITITASNMSGTTTTTTESSRCITRRNSFRRSSSWGLDPKRVLLFFATLLIQRLTFAEERIKAAENPYALASSLSFAFNFSVDVVKQIKHGNNVADILHSYNQ